MLMLEAPGYNPPEEDDAEPPDGGDQCPIGPPHGEDRGSLSPSGDVGPQGHSG